MKDPIAARKVQKADREKLRRDRLNEQFLELGNTLGRVLHLLSFFFQSRLEPAVGFGYMGKPEITRNLKYLSQNSLFQLRKKINPQRL